MSEIRKRIETLRKELKSGNSRPETLALLEHYVKRFNEELNKLYR